MDAPRVVDGRVVVAPAGLAILATEFVWARRLLAKVKSSATSAASAVSNSIRGRR